MNLEELIARCYTLKNSIENDPIVLKEGLQGDIWDEYRILIESEIRCMEEIINLLTRTEMLN